LNFGVRASYVEDDIAVEVFLLGEPRTDMEGFEEA